jgi:hypothetical protein
MSGTCLYLAGGSTYKNSRGITLEFCPPDYLFMMSDEDFSSFSNYESYPYDVYCMGSVHNSAGGDVNYQNTYPCYPESPVVEPVEFMTFHEIESGYGITPEVFVMTQVQIDLILTSMLVLTMCIAFCLGFSANESSAK